MAVLVGAPDATHHVDAPLLMCGVRESERLERHDEFGRPPRVVHRDLDVPHAFPVHVAIGFVARVLNVVVRADGVRREVEARLTVMEAVDEDAHAVLVPAREIALEPVDGQMARIRVPAADANIQVLRVVHEPHVGVFGRGEARVRIPLDEVVRRLRALPGGLGELPVNGDGFVDAQRVNHPLEPGSRVVDGVCRDCGGVARRALHGARIGSSRRSPEQAGSCTYSGYTWFQFHAALQVP